MKEAKRTAARAAKRVELYVGMLRQVGVNVGPQTRILDLGCGAGRLVKAGRAKGYDFYGCGMQLEDAFDPADAELRRAGIIREITENPYRLPFDDGTFDVIISDQVFEHVMDYPSTLSETQRVLKPGGCFLHSFPPRSMPIEPHVWVPLGTMVRTKWWLKSWALLGIRNQFQRRLSAEETANFNLQYLTTRTNYLPKRELVRQFSEYFEDVRFVEHAFLNASERGRKLMWFPFLPKLYGALRCRVAYGRRPQPAGNWNFRAQPERMRAAARS
jgi:SAM-dependent methyltransferase